MPLFSGDTYYIVVDGWGGDCGDYTLDIEESSPAADGDTCATAPVVTVPVGAPGSPLTTTFNGDSTAATGPDCGGELSATWWEAFTIDRCSKVTIDFCGTSPYHNSNYISLRDSCENGGNYCGAWIGADAYSRDDCGDNNITMYFDAIPAGTYYYPLVANGPERQHPYVMHVTAEECTGGCWGCKGACCNASASTCVDFVTPDACTGLNENWQVRAECCEMECRDPAGPEYVSADVNLLSRVPISSFSSGSFEANDVWGYRSPRGHRYAMIGLDRGTGFVEITDPRNPVVVDDIPDSYSIWSDQAVYGQYAYNVNESSGGMQIIDMTDIDNGNIVLTGSALGSLNTAHNVYVNPESGYAYACGDDWGYGFAVYDVSNPGVPFPVGLWGDAYVHDMQVVNFASCPTDVGYSRYGQPCEVAFLFTGYTTGVYIVDVTDKSNMVTLSTLVYPTIAYCHQGWLSEDRRYLFFNDEIDESWGNVGNVTTYVADVQNLSSPTLVHTFAGPGCNIDHNLITRGDRIYQAHYAAGLRVVDASNPLSLSEVAYFDTHPENNITDYTGAWGVYPFPNDRVVLISDIERGLFVLCDETSRPIPSFTISDNPAPPNTTLYFDATGSTHCDPALSIVSYEWDWNYDGVTFDVDATGTSPTTSYAVLGDYTVALRVMDDAASGALARAPASEILTLDIVIGAVCFSSSPVLADDGCCADDGFGRSVRYLSLKAGDPGRQQAIRVSLVDLDAPFDAYDGQALWVGPPVKVTENAGKTDPNDPLVAGFPTFWTAELQCDPYYMDWHGVCNGGSCAGGMMPGGSCSSDADCQAVMHVRHETIVPSSFYMAEVIEQSCSTSVPGSYSAALLMPTSRWGDVVKDCGGAQCGPPDGVINITTDVTAVLNKFKNLAGAPIKARADLDQDTPDLKVNISDVTFCLDGFGGFSYPFPAVWAGCP